MQVRIWHHGEIAKIETKKLRLVLIEGKIEAVDTDERLFSDVTMIEFCFS